MRCIGDDLRAAASRHRRLTAEEVLHRCGGDQRPRPERVRRDTARPQLLGEPEGQHRHAVLRERVRRMRTQPLGVQVDRRAEREDVPAALFQHLRAGLRHDIGPTHVDLHHEVEALDRELGQRREVDRAGVVDADVDAAEVVGGPAHGRTDRVGVTDVADDPERLAAGLLDLGDRRVHRPLQVGLGLIGLGHDRDVGTVAGRAQRDRQADAPAATGHEDRLAGEGGFAHGADPSGGPTGPSHQKRENLQQNTRSP